MKIHTGTVILVAALAAVSTLATLKADNMRKIKFALGQNIAETAKQSGAPRFSVGNVAGLISYELMNIPPDIPAYYAHPGFEISSMPLFAFTLYADEELHNGQAVESADLQFDTKSITSHESARKKVTELISQFRDGKWRRYIDELCPAVTGRSSYLNEAGQAEEIEGCPLDPEHQLSEQDWVTMMGATQHYRWIGDGVIAALRIGFSNDSRGITYRIHLNFDDFAIWKRRADTEQARKLAEGDAKGWNSTAKYKEGIQALKSRLKVLEENARKRGDKVVPR